VSDVLARICADKRGEVAARKAKILEAELRKRAGDASPVRGFAGALKRAVEGGRYGLIAEIKRASPSAGTIRDQGFDPPALARAYEAGGASCLSVLTDTPYFGGRDEDLVAARAAVTLPVLRKDFMVDPYQITEARAIGADCILVIMAAVDDALARELVTAASEWGMDALIEVHDEAELQRALALPAALIGINNRNLKTLKTDLAVTEALAPKVPDDRLLVAESGVARHADVARLAEVGARCFLVGTSLMAQGNLTAATRALLGEPAAEAKRA
jgi:indole-3-glycerol phosphate synthase